MARVTLEIHAVVSKDVSDRETLSELETVARGLADGYKVANPGWSYDDGEVRVLGVDHDWPEVR